MNQFNVYDIFGYVLPGTVVVGVVLFVIWPFNDLAGLSSLSGGVAMLLVCYVVGHVLHATFRRCIKPIKPSESLLSPAPPEKPLGDVFSDPLRLKIIDSLNSSFRLDLQLEPSEQKQQEAFDLAYVAIIQQGIAGYVPIYNSLYALYRGLLAASILSSVILAFNVVYLVGTWLIGGYFPSTLHTYATVVLFVLFFPLAWGGPWLCNSPWRLRWRKSPLRVQFDRYARKFAAGVYRNFLVWHQTKGLFG